MDKENWLWIILISAIVLQGLTVSGVIYTGFKYVGV